MYAISYNSTYLVSIWFDIDCPLVSVSIFLSLFPKVSCNISVDNRFDYCYALNIGEKV